MSVMPKMTLVDLLWKSRRQNENEEENHMQANSIVNAAAGQLPDYLTPHLCVRLGQT
jgi:hypothetical protein